ncbi:MAG TPA: hypothetical protein VIY48_08920 [Candidatus Paceibacterota bacterium]
MNIYLHEILEHQRVYDATSQRTHADVNVIHIFVDEQGTQWGCVHEPKRQLVGHEIETSKHITIYGEDVEYDKKRVRKWVPVHLEGQGWMSVHRDNDEASWIKTDGTDAGYRDALHELGFGDKDFKFHKANRIREPHVNEIPVVTPQTSEYTTFIAKPTRTPYVVICELADGWDSQGRPWFCSLMARQDALDRLYREFPNKSRRKYKSPCSVPLLMGISMGRYEDDPTQHMGYYLMEAK